MIICAGKNEVFEFAKCIGVGLSDSAINLTKVCLEEKPNTILFIGSAGSYGTHNIFDIVESSSAANMELSFLENNSYSPIVNIIKNNDENFINDTIVNSSNYITTNSKLGEKYLEYGIGIENMEFYSIVKVAREFNIDVKGIFIITNYTNKDAHKDFISNHSKAMNKLINELEQKRIIVPCGTKLKKSE